VAFTPFDCCALIYRQPEPARAIQTQDASDLDVIYVSEGEWNPTNYAYHLTARMRTAAVVFGRFPAL
jgi:aromatic-L-amino-acid/L-tryptophan decarboxylase